MVRCILCVCRYCQLCSAGTDGYFSLFDRLSFLEPTEAASSEFTSPTKLTKTLAASRIENLSFKEKLDGRDIEIRTRDRIIGELENRNEALEKECEIAKIGLSKAEGKVKQSERRIELRDKEVDMLKSSLVSRMAIVHHLWRVADGLR